MGESGYAEHLIKIKNDKNAAKSAKTSNKVKAGQPGYEEFLQAKNAKKSKEANLIE
jgi:hypothetical protein